MKKCEILGFGQYEDKETHDQKLRILLGVDSTNEKYTGLQIATAFLDYDSQLERNLKGYFEDKEELQAYYETTDNIVTGKTKVSKIHIRTKEQTE